MIGTLTWSFAGSVPEDVRVQIADAMDWAINMTNTLADYRGNVVVEYDPAVPTAGAGYLYVIRFGGFRDRVTALHELAHWLGSGTAEGWSRNVADGRFVGPVTDARLKAFDGGGSVLFADQSHFWPYGYDGDDPFREPQRNVLLVSAQRADMGLGDGASGVAGGRILVNRSSMLPLGGSRDAAGPPRAVAASDASLTWTVTFADGFVVIRNAASGLVVDSLGNTKDGSDTGLSEPSRSFGQQWEMLPTDAGWFLLRNRQTGLCLDNVNMLSVGSAIRLWTCGGHPNQQWHLAR